MLYISRERQYLWGKWNYYNKCDQPGREYNEKNRQLVTQDFWETLTFKGWMSRGRTAQRKNDQSN